MFGPSSKGPSIGSFAPLQSQPLPNCHQGALLQGTPCALVAMHSLTLFSVWTLFQGPSSGSFDPLQSQPLADSHQGALLQGAPVFLVATDAG